MDKDTKILIMGHPRSGTGMAAWLFRSCGFDVGHERLGKNGISSWFWAVPDSSPPYGATPVDYEYEPDLVIHLIRKPIDCVSSVTYTEHVTEPYRAKHFEGIDHQLPHVRACQSIYAINNAIDLFIPDFTVKTEYLAEFMRLQLGLQPLTPTKKINYSRHPTILEKCIEDWREYQLIKEQYHNAIG